MAIKPKNINVKLYDFGLEFAEIFVIENGLPASVTAGSGSVLLR
jgi:hypothetical protein